MSEGKVINFVLNPIGNQEKFFKKHYIKCLENSFLRFAVRMKEKERAVGRGVMGFLRKCGGEVRKVVKMDWGGITRYIWRRITTNFMVGLGRRNKEFNEFLWGARDWGEAL